MRLRLLISALGITVLAAILTRSPLLAVPGYESGLIVGAAAALGCCWLAFARARRRPEHVRLRWGLLERTPGESVLAETRATLSEGAALLCLPFLLLATAASRAGCLVAPGLIPYLLPALPAVLAGTALGLLAASVTRRRLRGLGLVVGLVGLSAATTGWEAWRGPRHVVHNLILGPLSASAYTGYDTGLDLPSSAYLHRAFAVLVWTALLALAALVRCRTDAPPAPTASREGDAARPADAWRESRSDDPERLAFLLAHHRRAPRRALLLVLLLSLPFLLTADRSGIGSGRGRLSRTLSVVRETDHFRIHHAPGTDAPTQIPLLAAELEASWERISEWLELSTAGRTDVWLHPDGETQFQLTGARGYVFAAPWNGEFHVHLGRERRPPVRHELVHVLAGEFGGWPFRASVSPGLIEGLATALDEGLARAPEAHEPLAAAAALGHLPPAPELTSVVGFARGNMDRSYRASASFVGYLLLTHGPGPLKQAYAWGDFEAAYGQDIAALDSEWRRFLGGLSPSASVAARARVRFDTARRPPFHRLPCPRVGQRWTWSPAAQARALGRAARDAEAAGLYCQAYRTSADPSHLEAAATHAVRAGRHGLARDLVDRALETGAVRADRIDRLLELRVRLLAAGGRWEEAEEALEERRRAGLAEWPELLELDAEMLAAPRLRERHVAALLAPEPARGEALATLLHEAPDFAPALAELLRRDLAMTGRLRPELGPRAERFAALVPEAPRLGAHFLLAAAGEAERRLLWAEASRLSARALDLPELGPLQRLAAEDAIHRASVGLRLAGTAAGAQPTGAACRQ